MTHKLKTWPKYFKEIRSGIKPFEIRKNDRNYAVGDTLLLQEWEPTTSQFTGQTEVRNVTYLLAGEMGVPDGYCIMGLQSDLYKRALELSVMEAACDEMCPTECDWECEQCATCPVGTNGNGELHHDTKRDIACWVRYYLEQAEQEAAAEAIETEQSFPHINI